MFLGPLSLPDPCAQAGYCPASRRRAFVSRPLLGARALYCFRAPAVSWRPDSLLFRCRVFSSRLVPVPRATIALGPSLLGFALLPAPEPAVAPCS
ncbi:unnamed protein product [Linum trigynum]|uniref:Uncharacterized protein n=1 Tax=Linum trigynum TaxID=586398 RepID=A0AAV2EMY8_9ROSI